MPEKEAEGPVVDGLNVSTLCPCPSGSRQCLSYVNAFKLVERGAARG